MNSKRWMFLAAACVATALFAQVNVEVQRIIEFVGDSLKVKTAEVAESMSTGDLTAATVTVEQGVSAQAVTSGGPVKAKSVESETVTTGALTVGTIGAQGPVTSIAAKRIDVGELVAKSLSVDKIILTSGGKPVGEWTPAGLVLNGSGATVQIKVDAEPQVTMKSADGKTTISASLGADSPSMTMVSSTGQTTWAVGEEQPTIVLGEHVYPPPDEKVIAPTEGVDDLEHQVRYWVSAVPTVKTKTSWKIEWTAQFQCIREFFRPRKINISVRFLDADGIQLAEQNAFDIALARNTAVAVQGVIEIRVDVAEQIRLVDLKIFTKH